MPEILEFLKTYRADTKGKNEPFTHTSMFNPRSSFYLKDKKVMKEFWKVYGKYYRKENVGITEKSDGPTPLRVDFDFKFPIEVGKQRLYTQKDIETIISKYYDIIFEMVDASNLDNEEEVFYCAVLEKSAPRSEEGFIKDGFHLHFPHFVVPATIQDGVIRKKIIDELEKDKALSDFRNRVVSKCVDNSNKPSKDIRKLLEKIVDPIGTKVWLMYGSRKNEKAEPFLATRYYDEQASEIEKDKFFGEEDVTSKDLPRLFSIQNQTATPLTSKTYENAQQYSADRRTKNVIKSVRPIEASLADLKTIEDAHLMDMIDSRRADDFNEWMDVGWTLFNIGQGHEKALDMWIEFSQQSAKFQEGECEKLWEKMELRGKTIASLFAMAKADDPDAYNQWRRDLMDGELDIALMTAKPNHLGVARTMHKKYEGQFVCADAKHDIWYEFYNHRWHEVDGGISILKKMVTEVSDIFLEYVNKTQKKLQTEDNDKLKIRRDRAFKYVQELGNYGFCNNCMKMCKIYFHDDNFFKKMNENRDILCFENGVYELNTGLFRNGSPDDYMTFSTGTKFQKYDSNDDEILALDDYLGKLFVNQNIRNYFLDFMCSCMKGGNRSKIFAVFTGESDTGKTTIVKCIKMIFGDFAMDFPEETFLMGKRSTAGSARPDLARVRGKRIGFITEVAKNQKLDISAVKKLTGNDSFWARNMYEKGADITPMFTAIMMCNEPPKIPANDDATWNRIRVIDFESVFPDVNRSDIKVPESVEEQYKKKIFPRDNYFDEKLADYVGALTWTLLQRFGKYLKEGLYEPKEVKLSSARYQKDNDLYKQFIEENIVKTTSEKKKITIKEAYTRFKYWITVNYPSLEKNEKPGQNLFETEVEKRLKIKSKNKKWIGLEFVENEEDEENEDEEYDLD